MNKPVINKSGLKPLGWSVLCEPYEPETTSSLIIIPPSAQERARMIETRMVVIEVGPEAWTDEMKPRAVPGDKVLVGKLAGTIVFGTADGVKYRMVNAGDIYCKIEKEGASQ